MPSILGIDAAWTENNPSGVALIRQQQNAGWECVAVAPSYESFIQLSHNIPVEWAQRPAKGLPDPELLLNAAQILLDREPVTVVSVDLPLSYELIVGRRPCDNCISREFGRFGCGTHTPNANRPGQFAVNLTQNLNGLGYPLATCHPNDRDILIPATIEVYPHPALLRLLHLDYRLPYKVANSRRYWPNTGIAHRKEQLVTSFHRIYRALLAGITDIPEFLQRIPENAPLNALKRYEDALDALICAWVGACYLEGRAQCFGDAASAIWVPCEQA